jgi:hypothetical protein
VSFENLVFFWAGTPYNSELGRGIEVEEESGQKDHRILPKRLDESRQWKLNRGGISWPMRVSWFRQYRIRCWRLDNWSCIPEDGCRYEGCSVSFSLRSNSSHYHIASGKPSEFRTKTGSVVWRKVIQWLLFEEWVVDSSCGDPFQKGYLDTIIYSGCTVLRHNVIDW